MFFIISEPLLLLHHRQESKKNGASCLSIFHPSNNFFSLLHLSREEELYVQSCVILNHLLGKSKRERELPTFLCLSLLPSFIWLVCCCEFNTCFLHWISTQQWPAEVKTSQHQFSGKIRTETKRLTKTYAQLVYHAAREFHM